ncbi:MAG: sigma-70 family RNA polymerase sigma factor [Eubacteriaceae bacterium]
MDEIDLIKKAQDGNRLSMNLLLENNYKMLYALLIKMTTDEELAKDLTQETMMKAVMNIKKFRGKSKFSSWLIRIGINNYKNYVKTHKVTYNTLDYELKSRENVENLVEAKEQVRKVNEVLKTVKSVDRIIFILKYYEGYDYKEISDFTGVKLGTCKSKMHYLINKLKLELEVPV